MLKFWWELVSSGFAVSFIVMFFISNPVLVFLWWGVYGMYVLLVTALCIWAAMSDRGRTAAMCYRITQSGP